MLPVVGVVHSTRLRQCVRTLVMQRAAAVQQSSVFVRHTLDSYRSRRKMVLGGNDSQDCRWAVAEVKAEPCIAFFAMASSILLHTSAARDMRRHRCSRLSPSRRLYCRRASIAGMLASNVTLYRAYFIAPQDDRGVSFRGHRASWNERLQIQLAQASNRSKDWRGRSVPVLKEMQ